MRGIFRLLIPVFLVVFGVVFIVLGISNYQSRADYLDTKAVISEIYTEYGVTTDDDEKIVIVDYEVDGQSYHRELNEYHPGYKEGQEIDILYRPDNPYDIMAKSLLFVYVMIGFGVVLIISAVISFLRFLGGR